MHNVSDDCVVDWHYKSQKIDFPGSCIADEVSKHTHILDLIKIEHFVQAEELGSIDHFSLIYV